MMGCEITVELHSCLWHVSGFFPHLLCSSLPFHNTRQKGGVLLACRRTAFTRHQSSHYECAGNGRPFVWFCFFFWCDIEFLALGCTSGQTIIAFSSLGSSLFSIWSLPLSDFTIRGGRRVWGGELGERKRISGSVISYGLLKRHGGHRG